MLGSAVGTPGDKSRVESRLGRWSNLPVSVRGCGSYIANKGWRVDRQRCRPGYLLLTNKRSSDREQVRDKHSALWTCLDGAGGIECVHRCVSRVHCSPACATRPIQQVRLPRCARPRGHAGLDWKWYQGPFKRGAVSALSV